MDKLFFDTWESLGRTVIITVLAYTMMIFFVRVSGKRTLSKMNAFDFIVTVGLGSTLASVALNKNVALIEGGMVFFLLILMQYIVSWLSVRNKRINKMVSGEPVLLLYRGEVLFTELKKQRITIEDMYLAARKKGVSDLKKVDAVVLEATGDIAFMPTLEEKNADVLKNIRNYS